MGGHVGAVESPAPLDILLNGSSLAENSDVGATWGTFIAIDPVGAPFTWVEMTDADGVGTLNTSTGALTLTQALDYETATSHSYTVRVVNRFGQALDKTFTLSVLDFDEDEDAAPPVNTVAPVISGTTKVDHVLTVSNGTWTGNAVPGFLYQWKRAGVAITNAVARTYTLTASDFGALITCTVTGRNQVTSVDATSASVGPITASNFLVSRYISVSGAGTQNGSSWANAGAMAKLDQFIGEAGADGIVYVRADAGNHPATLKTITHGGTSGHPVTIRGVDVNLAPMLADTFGSRQSPWDNTGNGNQGNEILRLMAGADHLSFEFLSFTNCGNGCFRVGDNISDLTIESCAATNVRRFLENNISGAATTATISGLTIRNTEVRGFSRAFARIQYASHDIVIEDCFGDSEEQDGDSFAVGIAFAGTAHDIAVDRTIMMRTVSTNKLGVPNSPDVYWNADCYSSENGNYNLTYTDCEASGSTDGGFDDKATNTSYVRCRSGDNKKNWRIWHTAALTDCFGYDAYKRGGNSAASSIWLNDTAVVTVTDSAFTHLTDDRIFDTSETTTGSLTTVNTSVQGSTISVEGGATVTLDNETPPPNTVLPLISGTTAAGSTLSVTNGTWTGSGFSYTYQWKRDDRFIPEATSNTYVLTSADIGRSITCSVYAKTGAGYVGEATSLAAGAVVGVAPTIDDTFISGLPRLGGILTANTGTVTGFPTPTFAYNWKRDGVVITNPNSDKSVYVIVAADVGHSLRVDIQASNATGSDTDTTDSVSITAAAVGVLYIGPARDGVADGSDWDNQGQLSDLNSFLAGSLGGSTIYLAADQGNYTITGGGPTITHGGSAGAHILIRGVEEDLTPAVATMVGNRTGWSTYAAYLADPETRTSVNSWTVGPVTFQLMNGANYLTFDYMRFENMGNGCFFINPSDYLTGIHDLIFTNMEGFNVKRGLEMNGADALNVSNILITDWDFTGFSECCCRFSGDSRNIKVKDVYADSGRQDRDDFAMCFQMMDTAHNIEFINVEAKNTADTTSAYYNGDGFTAERGNYNIHWKNCTSTGHYDAGIDTKQGASTADWLSGSTTTYREIAVHDVVVDGGTFEDCKKNLKFWGDGINVRNATVGASHHRGGSGTRCQYSLSPSTGINIYVEGGTIEGDSALTVELLSVDSLIVLDGVEINNPSTNLWRSADTGYIRLVDCTGTSIDAINAALTDYTTPTFRSPATFEFLDGNTPTPDMPPVKVGDVVVMVGLFDYSTTLPTPSIPSRFGETWTLSSVTTVSSVFGSFIAWRRMDAIEFGPIRTASIGNEHTAGFACGAAVASFSGCVATGTPYEGYGATTSTTISSTSPTVAVTGSDRAVLHWHATSDNGSWGSAPAGYTQVEAHVSSVAGDAGEALLIKTGVGAGTAAATTHNVAGAPNVCHALALIPV